MKFSTVLVTVFSSLALAAPALNARANVDQAKVTLKDLDAKNTEMEEQTEKSLQDQEDRKKAWTESVGQQVDRVNELKGLVDEPREKELVEELAKTINESAQKAEKARDRLQEQRKRREKNIQDFKDIAERFRAALNDEGKAQ